MKLAVIKTGGKQYLVKESDKLKIEKLEAQAGDKVEFETLMISDGDNLEIGTPLLETKVSATAIKQGRLRKVTGIKYKPKTRQSKRFGHKQYFTEVEIAKI
ncbi:MAG: 50S ribosomal protein L21 [Patescibacteria group bacterium]|jgi:large subunit ribosomal protein L21